MSPEGPWVSRRRGREEKRRKREHPRGLGSAWIPGEEGQEKLIGQAFIAVPVPCVHFEGALVERWRSGETVVLRFLVDGQVRGVQLRPVEDNLLDVCLPDLYRGRFWFPSSFQGDSIRATVNNRVVEIVLSLKRSSAWCLLGHFLGAKPQDGHASRKLKKARPSGSNGSRADAWKLRGRRDWSSSGAAVHGCIVEVDLEGWDTSALGRFDLLLVPASFRVDGGLA